MPGEPIQLNPDIRGTQAPVGGYPSPLTENPVGVAAAGTVIYLSSLESVSKSEHAHDRDTTLPYSPVLPFPFSNVPLGPIEFGKVIVEAYQKCVQSICDAWVEQTKKSAENQKKEWKDRIRLGLDQLTKAAVGSDQSVSTVAGGTALVMIIVSFMTPAGQVQQVQMLSAIQQPGVNVIQGLSQVAASAGLIPGHMQAELGLLGGLLAASTFYPSMVSVMKETLKGEEGYTMKFAAAYAKQVAKLVQGPQFDAFIHTMLLTGKDLTDREKQNALVGVKLAFLFAALGLVYKVETGHVIGGDIAGMLDGTTKLPQKDPRILLIEMINSYLTLMPNQGKDLKTAFVGYFDDNPSIEDISSPARMINSLKENKDYERLTQNRGD